MLIRLKEIQKHRDAIKLLSRIWNPDAVTEIETEYLKLIGGSANVKSNSNEVNKNALGLYMYAFEEYGKAWLLKEYLEDEKEVK
jgi:hypothetical protein